MIIQHPEYQHALELNQETGLPSAIFLRQQPLARVRLENLQLSLLLDGTEVRSATGGIDYQAAITLAGTVANGAPVWSSSAEGDACAVPIRLGEAAAYFECLFRRHGPALTMRLVVVGDANSTQLIRNISLAGDFIFEPDDWRLNAPGNGMARDTAFGTVSAWTGISAIGGLRGSSAVLHMAGRHYRAALWLRHELEVTDIRVKSDLKNTVSLELATNFAADLSLVQNAKIDLFDFDWRVPDFATFPQTFATWLRLGGHSTPDNPPTWIASASIFEAQIGFSVFYPNHRYAPYPEVSDLTADLERIAALGFSVIQLMPRQPYPSYNVHDYWDITTSFGNLQEIKALVLECHRLGLRIILDVLLHGVLDQESIAAAADGVRAGPYAGLVSSQTTDSFSADVGEWSDYLVAWSRHIIDFEPFWKTGSPAISPLIEQHPDWFFKDSNGKIAGIYTKAFDARNPEWQDYFIAAMKFLLSELQIDGFRFDAPTYNDFPNWAQWSRHRASLSSLACVPLFERLRPELKAVKADALMYTEPSGILLRRSMDLNYNYDEQWLVTAISEPSKTKPWSVSSARGLARWVQDRDAFLPKGAITAHHIDSHDTFWWPSWGQKWRREQFSVAHTQLLTLIFMSLPGPYMMFIGGETGIETVLQNFNALKAATRDWASMNIQWLTDELIPENVFGMIRSHATLEIITLVNLSDTPETVVLPSSKTAPIIRLAVGADLTLLHITAASLELPAKSGFVLERHLHLV